MTARLALALLFIVPAVLAYPYETMPQRWILGIAIVVVILLFAWWGGDFATTKLARRRSIWHGNRSGVIVAGDTTIATVLLRVDEPAMDELPVALIAGYTDRYGLRCDKVRITSRDLAGERQTWITLTLAATENLRSLQARSSRIPLQDTVDVLGRRLTDHLSEDGWSVTAVDGANRPAPLSGEAKETWRAMTDGSGFLTAYRIPADALPETLAAVWAHPSEETWTAVEFGPGTVSSVCALRTSDRPASAAPVPGLGTLRGRQRSVLDALDPLSSRRIGDHQVAAPALAEELRWPTGAAIST
ncbi:type VII secretion protein EccE [Mycobacterium sp. Root135]|uniref:type VII secretion protein EccE n=1 Tax=Mycobacterium sp. Root135 TaxID=1736457 RepID=UPI0009E75F4D|nr:type VII secretion protein EccE [Mycobacterium sp. Root135]